MGNPLAKRRNTHHKESMQEMAPPHREKDQVSQELQTTQCHILKLFLNLGYFLLNLADPEVLISTLSLDDLAIFLNIFFKMNKPDKCNVSYKLP